MWGARLADHLRTGRSLRLVGTLALACLAPPLLAPFAAARDLDDDDPIEITADEIVYESRRSLYTADGSVRVVQKGKSVEGDWAVFNAETRRGIAVGNVRVVDGDEVLEARFVDFDFDEQLGLLYEGRLDTGPGGFKIGAAELQKTGKDSYEIEEGLFTTCRCPEDDDPKPWEVSAKKGDVEVGGYAKLKNATLEVLGVPALWLPWMIFPVKTERESGFLLPEVGFGGRNGYELAVPLFWAARDNVNVTATSRWLSDRGFKPELEVETVYGQKSGMELYGTYIRDTENKVHKQNLTYGTDRWAAELDNDAHLPLGWRARSDITLISDNQYPSDFDDLKRFRVDRFVESTAFAFRHFGERGLVGSVIDLEYADDRQNPDRRDRDAFLMQRAPTVELELMPLAVEQAAGLDFTMGFEFTNFQPYERAKDYLNLSKGNNPVIGKDLFIDIGIDAIPEGVSGNSLDDFGANDGIFEEGEPTTDEGQRFDLHPRLSRSFLLFDWLEVDPEIGWHQTFYTTRAQSYADRGLLTARTELRTRFLGSFDAPLLPEITHVVEPMVGWAFVSDQSQKSNPLFVPATAVPQTRLRQLSLENVTLDMADRVDRANILTAGLQNRFYVRPGSGGRSLRAELTLSAAYDFAGNREWDRWLVDARSFSASGIRGHYVFSWDPDADKIAEGLVDFQLPLAERPFWKSAWLDFGYRYRRQIPRFAEQFQGNREFKKFRSGFSSINQITAGPRIRLTDNWAIHYATRYSFEQEILLGNQGTIEYTSSCECWAIQFVGEQDRQRGFQFNLRFTLLGLGDNPGNPFAGKQSGFGSDAL